MQWHLGVDQFLPTQHGFDYYFGVPHGLGACPCRSCFFPNETCAISCQPDWAPCPLYENTTIIQQPPNYLTLSQQYVRAANRVMTSASTQGVPFLVYFCSHHVHSPQFAGEDTTNQTQRDRQVAASTANESKSSR